MCVDRLRQVPLVWGFRHLLYTAGCQMHHLFYSQIHLHRAHTLSSVTQWIFFAEMWLENVAHRRYSMMDVPGQTHT